MNNRYIVIVGNPVDGFSFFGLFDSAKDAGDWAECECKNQTWWTAELKEP